MRVCCLIKALRCVVVIITFTFYFVFWRHLLVITDAERMQDFLGLHSHKPIPNIVSIKLNRVSVCNTQSYRQKALNFINPAMDF